MDNSNLNQIQAYFPNVDDGKKAQEALKDLGVEDVHFHDNSHTTWMDKVQGWFSGGSKSDADLSDFSESKYQSGAILTCEDTPEALDIIRQYNGQLSPSAVKGETLDRDGDSTVDTEQSQTTRSTY